MKIKRLKDCKQFIAGDNSLLREILNPHKERLELNYSLACAKVKPGKMTLKHRLKYSEVYFILKGKGILYIDKEKKIVNPSDTVYIPPGSIQRIKNIGKKDLEFLCIVEPAWVLECEEVFKE